jgi:AbrB family looped-hinge helix DNA binding protein
MILKNVLAKGQIVIPKTIRELLGINIGDKMIVDVENGKIILSKKQDIVETFVEVSKKSPGKISIKKINKDLKSRYEED